MRLSRSIQLFGLVALCGCEPQVPGEPVGTFDVVMSLEKNGCGEGAVYITDGQRFAVELRAEEHLAYWRVPEQPLIQGHKDDGGYKFVTRTLVDTSDPDAGPLCQLVQTAELLAKVHAQTADGGVADGGTDAAVEEGSGLVLDATYTLTIEAVAGTDCARAISPQGVFKALPCAVEYSFAGTEREPLD